MKIRIVQAVTLFLAVSALGSCAFFNRQAKLAALAKQRFSVNESSPNVEIGGIEAQFNRPFPLSGVEKKDIAVTYYPFEDAVCLQFRSNSVTYNQFWHRAGRAAYVKAMEKYNEDFSNQRLKARNNSRTKTQYGASGGLFLIWYAYERLSVHASGNMEMQLGYYFRENAPFFAVTQMEAFFESPSLEKENNEYSSEIPIFLTRAQADRLAGIFDQEYLQSVIPEMYIPALNRNANRRTDNTPDFDSF
jgi:hypothetical protein